MRSSDLGTASARDDGAGIGLRHHSATVAVATLLGFVALLPIWSTAFAQRQSTSSRGTTFRSTVYPYRLQLPRGWTHELILMRPQPASDYFFPPVADKVATSVAISARKDSNSDSRLLAVAMAQMESMGGRRVRVLKHRLSIDHLHVRVVQGDFGNQINPWSLRQAAFVDGGYAWLITVSWDHRLRRLLPTLEAIVKTFRVINPRGHAVAHARHSRTTRPVQKKAPTRSRPCITCLRRATQPLPRGRGRP